MQTRQVRPVVADGEAEPVSAMPTSQIMRLDITLPLRNQADLTALLQRLYDPSSPDYRQFLSVAEFTAQFGPTAQDYDTVVQWAKANGFTVGKEPANRLLVPITGTVAQVNQAFHVTMTIYKRPSGAVQQGSSGSDTFFAPDREPTVDVSVPIWHIAGFDNFSIPQPANLHRSSGVTPNATTGSGPGNSFLGSDMRAAYYGGTALTGSGQSVGLLEYLGTDLSDLTTYFTNVGQTNNVPIHLYSVDGSSTSCVSPCNDAEQTLDMTQAIGMAPGLSRLVLYIGQTGAAILNAMATGYNGTLDYQLSSSWTWTPSSPTANDNIFREFQAQGQNFFQAAGDWGAWSTTIYDQNEVYPADDPLIVSVGGTELTTGSAGGSWSSETAWSDNGSGYSTGGGISPSPDLFPIPSWQTTAAANCASCSQTYRNGPDVAANADWSFYVCANQAACYENGAGTSFAAPMWAGYMALMNQQAKTNGFRPIGFLNPLIYPIAQGSSYSTDFHDITNGCNNTYCAATNYDLVTGLGSPNGASLINALAPGCSSQPPGTYYPVNSSFSTTLKARKTWPDRTTSVRMGPGFACNPVTSATLYVTASGTIPSDNGYGDLILYYSKDAGATWIPFAEWYDSFGPTTASTSITGITNLRSVYVKMELDANWTAPPFFYTVSGSVSNIYATTN